MDLVQALEVRMWVLYVCLSCDAGPVQKFG